MAYDWSAKADIRFFIYKYDNVTSRWIYVGEYVDFIYRPETIRVDHALGWRHRASGTKRYEVFRWKGRENHKVSLSGKCRTSMWRRLEWLATGKFVVDIIARYTEPGQDKNYYPLLSPVKTFPEDENLDPTLVSYDIHAFYIITNIDGTSTHYRAVGAEQEGAKLELLHDFTLVLQRVDVSKITVNGEYLPE